MARKTLSQSHPNAIGVVSCYHDRPLFRTDVNWLPLDPENLVEAKAKKDFDFWKAYAAMVWLRFDSQVLSKQPG